MVWCRCVALRVAPLPSGLLYRSTMILTRAVENGCTARFRATARRYLPGTERRVSTPWVGKAPCFGRFGPAAAAAHVSTRFLCNAR